MDEVDRAIGGNDVARDDRQAEAEGRDVAECADHGLLVSVRGVDDEHVCTCVRQRLRFTRSVAVDAHGDRYGEATVCVERGAVDRRAERRAARERAEYGSARRSTRNHDDGFFTRVREQRIDGVEHRAGVRLGVGLR